MAFNCWYTWNEGREEFVEMFPVSLVLLGCTHLTWRAPYKRWTLWETPLVLLSVALTSTGAFLFTPEGEERQFAFQAFLAVFAALALSYGFFCTAIKVAHPARKAVIEPTKRVSRFGVIGADIGLVAAPFAFLYYLLRYHLGRS